MISIPEGSIRVLDVYIEMNVLLGECPLCIGAKGNAFVVEISVVPSKSVNLKKKIEYLL